MLFNFKRIEHNIYKEIANIIKNAVCYKLIISSIITFKDYLII